MAKQVVKIADLANLGRPVDISDTKVIMVRALNLREMVGLFIKSRDVFLPLYASGLEGKFGVEDLAPFLISAPDLVAQIIAMASDDPDSAPLVDQNMPATVQLIALSEIWQASVPDQKKAKELWSEVTKLLQRLNENAALPAQPPPSPTTLPQP